MSPGKGGRRTRRPGTAPTTTTATPPDAQRPACRIPGQSDPWGECAGGCGPALLVQDTAWCWDCTYKGWPT